MRIETIAIPLPEGLPERILGIAKLESASPIVEDIRVEDHRLSQELPVHRCLRVIHESGHDWWSRLIQRLVCLAGCEMPHVERVLEVGQTADGIYLLTDDALATLVDLVPPKGGDERIVREVLRQIAVGLTQLHQQVGPHGHLHLRCIGVDQLQLDEDARISIGHVELGLVPSWSRNHVLLDGYHQSRPPEWKGDGTDQPTKEGDWYALGLIGAQLLLGMTGFREASQAAKDSHQSLAIILDREFARGTSRSLRKLLRWLLATKPSDRPQNGNRVVDRLNSSGWPNWSWPVAAAVLLAVLAMLGFRPREPLADHQELSQLEQELESRNAELSRVKATLEQRREEAEANAKRLLTVTIDLESQRSASQIKDEKLKQVADLVARPTPDLPNRINAVLSPNAPPDPGEQAKLHWSHLKSDQSTSKLFASLEQLRKDRKIPDDQFKLLKGWVGLLDERSAKWSPWASRSRPEESAFIEAWRKYQKTPWEESLRQNADQTLDSLDRASAIWWFAANQANDPWDEICKKLDREAKAAPDPTVERVLNAWISAFNRQTEWSLRLGKAAGPAGNGRERVISVSVNNGAWQVDGTQKWSSDTEYDYRPKTFAINWRRGESVRVLLEGEFSYLWGNRTDLLDKTFASPVVLWSLHQDGVISQGGFSLEIEVADCPGPPRSIIQLLRQRMNEAAATKPANK